ncbi:alkylhydroperoxidase [Candidatus Woesearchaeota archaeon CG10_big_fil_rev_8_21_14_0_10_47_5]|nr:MAG: alkylhydroperoxidase [Candidatus Woesearchaeota archaeon CG10_big_fil_rev_8_21_14_0_10_47_5]HII30160.1 carboxymuconolactone decarboxylase family protein [Candidatus Woesearchaeota archaeon]
MNEMKGLFDEVNASLGRFSKVFPKETGAFANFMHTVESPGELDAKQKELISVALAVVKQCKWCIALHVKNALDRGASRKEIEEASWLAVLMGGGPALMYFQLVEKALDEFSASP